MPKRLEAFFKGLITSVSCLGNLPIAMFMSAWKRLKLTHSQKPESPFRWLILYALVL